MTDRFENPFTQGLAAAHAGDYATAERIAADLLARNRNDVHGHQILGYSRFQQGRFHEALDAFLQANRLAPNQGAILNWLATIYREIGDMDLARKAGLAAARAAPKDAEILSNLGVILGYLRDTAGADRAFDAALKSNPSSVIALCRAARFKEQSHRNEEARALAERAAALQPDSASVAAIFADLDQKAGDHAAVVARLAPFVSSETGDPRLHSQFHHQTAEALHKLGRHDEAYDQYVRSNEIQKTLYTDLAARETSPLTPDSVRRLQRYFTERDDKPWTTYGGFSSPAPVFLLGFFRSGTTWLEQIFASHPEATVLDEEDNFWESWNELYVTDDGLARLPSLSLAEVEQARSAYWRRVRSKLTEKPDARIVVDKNPINTVMLGLIHRIFPDAKIIFAVRDPRDVVWSCFQQRFAINAAMYQLLTLETAARYYDDVMSLGALFRERFAFDLLESRYEDVVADFDGSIRRILAFLDLDWSEALANYQETARKRINFTPSARQVVQKPYSSSIGKWRAYERHMAPVLPLLDKWVKTFGYDA